jgi:hypothetical protein
LFGQILLWAAWKNDRLEAYPTKISLRQGDYRQFVFTPSRPAFDNFQKNLFGSGTFWEPGTVLGHDSIRAVRGTGRLPADGVGFFFDSWHGSGFPEASGRRELRSDEVGSGQRDRGLDRNCFGESVFVTFRVGYHREVESGRAALAAGQPNQLSE